MLLILTGETVHFGQVSNKPFPLHGIGSPLLVQQLFFYYHPGVDGCHSDTARNGRDVNLNATHKDINNPSFYALNRQIE